MRKIAIKIIGVIMAAMLLVLPATSFAETNEAVLAACESVVRIYTYSSSIGQGYIGSGFAIGPEGQPVELIVTNCHVITDDYGNICDEIYVVLQDLEHPESILTATPVSYDPAIDYAILSIEPTTERKPLALMSAKSIERSETVYALGFPGVSDSINDAGDILPSTIDDITITRGIVSKTNAQSAGVNYIQSDCTINGGNSGGPLLTEDGICIGINTFSATEGVSTFGSIYIDYVLDVLKEAGVPYTEGAPESTAGPEPSAIAASGNASGQTGNSGTVGGLNTGSIIAIAAVLVMLMISSVYMVKRAKNSKGRAGYVRRHRVGQKAEKADPYETFTEYEARKASAMPVLRCESGQFAGNEYPVEGNILIGRDQATCNIVYPDGTPGISMLHCKIVTSGSDAYVVDLDSSYGTFLLDGTKLTPYGQYPLKSGEGFYLAERRNTFTIK